MALIALRLISIGTSESDVERVNSMHKYIVRDRMTHIKGETILARLRLKCASLSNTNLKKMDRKILDSSN